MNELAVDPNSFAKDLVLLESFLSDLGDRISVDLPPKLALLLERLERLSAPALAPKINIKDVVVDDLLRQLKASLVDTTNICPNLVRYLERSASNPIDFLVHPSE